MSDKKPFNLSPQAVGSIMMAVQKGMLAAANDRPKEECDITQMLLGFELLVDPNGNLVVLNPPDVHFSSQDLPPEPTQH